ncbi:MAG: hypothetical protein ACYC1Q_01665 [Bacteroidia bacterium]
MKTLFQVLMIASMLSIFLDITSCNREYSNATLFPIEGQFVDIITRQPVKNVELRMEASDRRNRVLAVADEKGHFKVSLPFQENPDYSLYLQDARYTIVNANRHVSRFENSQVWYLLPVNSH